jgi:hypothetical protein
MSWFVGDEANWLDIQANGYVHDWGHALGPNGFVDPVVQDAWKDLYDFEIEQLAGRAAGWTPQKSMGNNNSGWWWQSEDARAGLHRHATLRANARFHVYLRADNLSQFAKQRGIPAEEFLRSFRHNLTGSLTQFSRLERHLGVPLPWLLLTPTESYALLVAAREVAVRGNRQEVREPRRPGVAEVRETVRPADPWEPEPAEVDRAVLLHRGQAHGGAGAHHDEQAAADHERRDGRGRPSWGAVSSGHTQSEALRNQSLHAAARLVRDRAEEGFQRRDRRE